MILSKKICTALLSSVLLTPALLTTADTVSLDAGTPKTVTSDKTMLVIDDHHPFTDQPNVQKEATLEDAISAAAYQYFQPSNTTVSPEKTYTLDDVAVDWDAMYRFGKIDFTSPTSIEGVTDLKRLSKVTIRPTNLYIASDVNFRRLVNDANSFGFGNQNGLESNALVSITDRTGIRGSYNANSYMRSEGSFHNNVHVFSYEVKFNRIFAQNILDKSGEKTYYNHNYDVWINHLDFQRTSSESIKAVLNEGRYNESYILNPPVLEQTSPSDKIQFLHAVGEDKLIKYNNHYYLAFKVDPEYTHGDSNIFNRYVNIYPNAGKAIDVDFTTPNVSIDYSQYKTIKRTTIGDVQRFQFTNKSSWSTTVNVNCYDANGNIVYEHLLSIDRQQTVDLPFMHLPESTTKIVVTQQANGSLVDNFVIK